MIDGVLLTPLKIINVSGGDVFHAMKNSDDGFAGFGEAYFSAVETGAVKAWKRHREMILNIIVPVGEIRFIIFDDRNKSKKQFQEVLLSKNNYCRLTVPPMVWMGFQGMDRDTSMLLNVASIPHVSSESDKKTINEIIFDWSMK